MTPVWILNLERSADRYRHMEEQCQTLGLSYERFDAVDGTRDPVALRALAGERAFDTQPWLGRALTPNEIGCALSHVAAWKRLADGDAPAAVILEDDVDLGSTLGDVIAGLETLGSEYGLVLLGHHSNRYPWIPGASFDHRHGALTTFAGRDIRGGARVAELVEYAQGAYAYYLTRDAARRLLAFASPIRMPADSVTGYAPRAGLRSFAVTRPVVVPNARFATTMTEVRQCSCRVCVRRRLASSMSESAPTDRCVNERTGATEALRTLGGRVLLFARRLGIAPGTFWAPSLR